MIRLLHKHKECDVPDNDEPTQNENPFLPKEPQTDTPIVESLDTNELKDTTPTVTGAESQQTEPSLPPQKPKSKKKLIILLIIIAALIAAAAGVYVYSYINKQNDAPAKTNATSTSDTTPKEVATPQGVVDEVKNRLVGTQVAAISSDKASFIYRLEGNKYFSAIEEGAMTAGATSVVKTQAAVDKEQEISISTLKEKGLVRNSISDIKTDFVGTTVYMSSDEIVCRTFAGPDSEGAVYNTTTKEYDAISFTFTVSCANISDYEKNAATVKPFYDAYFKADNNYFDNMMFTVPTIKDSKTAGYKTAHISLAAYGATVGGFAGLFYQTPDGTWHYFLGSQSELLCTQYNTDDLKKAYLGEMCYDEKDESATVKL